MKKYLIRERVKQIISYIFAFAFMVILGYFFDGKKLTSDNFVFASIMTVVIIIMDISKDIKYLRDKKKAEKKKKADA